MVVPEAENVTVPAPVWTIIQLKPAAREGTVRVTSVPLLKVKIFPLSARVNVYESVFETSVALKFAIVEVALVLPDTFPDAVTEVGVISPRLRVIAGVVELVATVPETPLAVVTETVVTVPFVGVVQVGAPVPPEVSTCPDVPAASIDVDPVPV